MTESWAHLDLVKGQRDRARDIAVHSKRKVYRLEQAVAERDHTIIELEDEVARLTGELAEARDRHPSSRGW